jgi:hypothetical protein
MRVGHRGVAAVPGAREPATDVGWAAPRRPPGVSRRVRRVPGAGGPRRPADRRVGCRRAWPTRSARPTRRRGRRSQCGPRPRRVGEPRSVRPAPRRRVGEPRSLPPAPRSGPPRHRVTAPRPGSVRSHGRALPRAAGRHGSRPCPVVPGCRRRQLGPRDRVPPTARSVVRDPAGGDRARRSRGLPSCRWAGAAGVGVRRPCRGRRVGAPGGGPSPHGGRRRPSCAIHQAD